LITIRQKKYLNNILEQDHRLIKRITGSMLGFNLPFPRSNHRWYRGRTHDLRGQFGANSLSAFQQFTSLAA